LVTEVVAGSSEEDRADAAVLKERVRLALRRFMQKTFDRRPMVVPVVIDVEGASGNPEPCIEKEG
jgi:ribonuclease J